MAFIRHRTVGEQARKDHKVPAALLVFPAQVGDRNIGAAHVAVYAERFMHRSLPSETAVAAHDALAVKVQRGVAEFVESGVVSQIKGVGRAVERIFQRKQGEAVFFQKDIVRIQPHQIIGSGFGEGKIPCGGKVLPPGKVKHFIGKFRRDAFRRVFGTGVGDHDFVENAAHAQKAAPQHFFFVLYDHAQSKRHLQVLFCVARSGLYYQRM